MSDAALLRARLAAALRALPSELAHREPRCAGVEVPGSVRDLASELERVSPGLALMMQLRARLFDAMARAASRRGFTQMVTVGRGFERRHSPRVRTIVVEHPAVLGSARRFPGADVRDLGVTDLADGVGPALACRRYAPPRHRTLFLVEGLSFWGSAGTLQKWLDAFSRYAPGSEMLLNLLDGEGAAHARSTIETLAPGTSAAGLEVRVATAPAPMRDLVAARGLEIVATFDSHALQHACLGVTDLLIREHYLWLGRPGAADVVAAPPLSTLLAPSPRRRRWRIPSASRPRLRPDVAVETGEAGTAVLSLPVTALRRCTMVVSARRRAIASLFDGRHSIAEIGELLGRDIVRDAVELAGALRARGFLACDLGTDGPALAAVGAAPPAPALVQGRTRSACHAAVLRELAFTALATRDTGLARRVVGLIGVDAGNAAADHLRAVLRDLPVLTLTRVGRFAVIARAPSTSVDARAILADTAAIARAIGRLLEVRCRSHVVIDVATHRAAIPVTVVAESEPYTLVRIPLPVYSRSMLCHELTHVLAMSRSRWLAEGLAVWAQRRIAPGPCFPDDRLPEPGATSDAPVAALLLGGAGAPATAPDRAAYRAAAAFVDWLIASRGLRAFARLFRACDAPGAMHAVEVVCRAIGFRSLAHVEEEWRRCA